MVYVVRGQLVGVDSFLPHVGSGIELRSSGLVCIERVYTKTDKPQTTGMGRKFCNDRWRRNSGAYALYLIRLLQMEGGLETQGEHKEPRNKMHSRWIKYTVGQWP